MIRFISAIKNRRLQKDSAPASRCNLDTRQAPVKAKARLQLNKLLFSKVKTFPKKIYTKASKVLAKNSLDKIYTGPKLQLSDQQDLEIVQLGKESGRTFTRFEDLPVELRLHILEFYLGEPRITTIQFRSNALVQYHSVFGRSYQLICGSLPPILSLNHEYRNTFLERFTVTGLPKSQTTLSIEEVLEQAEVQQLDATFDDSTNDSISTAFPVFETYTCRHIIYQPKDFIWIQGDFWLDELRRSILARSVFYDLQNLAVHYNTRNENLFELDEMWRFIETVISTFPHLKTIAFVLDVGEVVAERPIYNGEINFTIPRGVQIVSGVPADAKPSRGLFSKIRNLPLNKKLKSHPKLLTRIKYWPEEELTDLMRRTLEDIKAHAIEIGYNFPISGWDTEREVEDWVVPNIEIVRASLSTSPRTPILRPTMIDA
ncbi:hypothetical protein DSL72_005277 [Monilinia vaccinii-corymbosi]|uniref:2EXR domain-containing protein n=1 Tax=Monilinia vaccinii-corymbosi TaxID=61207 RepID=A0A8A3PF92_9HELO|nr:hypothetical protein DSL72_005277 [Monilinia vaccinii-corymbosi]